MSQITQLDLLEGENQHITVKDQAGRVLPAEAVSFATDSNLGSNLTVAADPAGGFVVTAVSAGDSGALAGVLVVSGTRGAQSASLALPATISAALTAITVETP